MDNSLLLWNGDSLLLEIIYIYHYVYIGFVLGLTFYAYM